MSRFAVPILLLIVLPLTMTCHTSLAQGVKAEVRKEFTQANAALGRLVVARVNQGRLSLDLPVANEAMNICRQMVTARGMSSQSGGATWACRAQGQYLDVVFEQASDIPGRNQVARKYISVKSKEHPHLATFVQETKDEFLAWSLDAELGQFVMITETPHGCRMIAVQGESIQAESGDSFAQMLERRELTPLLAQFANSGIGLETNIPWELISSMLGPALMVDEQKWSVFLEEFADLDQNRFMERKAAEERLAKQVDQWTGEIIYGLSKGLGSAEFRSRIRQAAVGDGSDVQKAAINKIVSEGLMDEPFSLVRLLADTAKAAPDSELHGAIVEQLTKVTDQELGGDLDGWEKWLTAREQTRQEEKEDLEVAADPAAEAAQPPAVSAMDLANEDLTQLLCLTFSASGSLTLDRDQWSQRFGNRPVKEWITELQEKFRESNLPDSWLNMGNGFDLDFVDYPQVLFERIAETLKSSPLPNSFVNAVTPSEQGNRSWNRMLQNQVVKMHLVEERAAPQSEPTESAPPLLFEFGLEELQGTQRRLLLRETKGGGFLLMLVNQKLGELIWLQQESTGKIWLHHYDDHGSIKTITADSAKQLFDENADWMASEFSKTTQSHGLAFPHR